MFTCRVKKSEILSMINVYLCKISVLLTLVKVKSLLTSVKVGAFFCLSANLYAPSMTKAVVNKPPSNYNVRKISSSHGKTLI